MAALTYQELNADISAKKIELKHTDPIAIKFLLGEITEKEFDPIRSKRAELISGIASQEKKLAAAKKKWDEEHSHVYDEEEE